MRGTWIAAVLMFGIGVGCVAATVAKDLVVPPVRAGTNPTPWEYQCGSGWVGGKLTTEGQTQYANKMGKEGWEVAVAYGDNLCFKRPLP